MNAASRNPRSPADLPPLRRVTANILTGLGRQRGLTTRSLLVTVGGQRCYRSYFNV